MSALPPKLILFFFVCYLSLGGYCLLSGVRQWPLLLFLALFEALDYLRITSGTNS